MDMNEWFADLCRGGLKEEMVKFWRFFRPRGSGRRQQWLWPAGGNGGGGGGRPVAELEVVYRPKQAKIISYIRARKLIGQGCLAYLAHIKDVEIEAPSIESIPVVSEFREMFPNDLPGMPPDRDIHLCTDLEPGTHPISIPPYRMAPTELREFKAQIQELLDNGFIRPSASP
ncbi:hypothetical protein MTR67_038784 [Solanum verrucosum]|uniref:Uncharacterized protein n=1 Tax=Solanum verrucosum TaxID=315347 RepID=A0AAF0UGG7_SOLVR|nr:hypothetical protein MTR67_038784 [Solanum verrucosum]